VPAAPVVLPLLLLATCSRAERDMTGYVSVAMLQDGHFVFEPGDLEDGRLDGDLHSAAELPPQPPVQRSIDEQLLDHLPGQDIFDFGVIFDQTADRPTVPAPAVVAAPQDAVAGGAAFQQASGMIADASVAVSAASEARLAAPVPELVAAAPPAPGSVVAAPPGTPGLVTPHGAVGAGGAAAPLHDLSAIPDDTEAVTGARRAPRSGGGGRFALAVEPQHVGSIVATQIAGKLGSASMLEVARSDTSTDAWLAETSRLLALLHQEPEGEPFPEQTVKEKPKTWSSMAWSAYQAAHRTISGFRGGAGNVVATFAALGLGPDSCILKLCYTLYTHVGEDDYPYMPEGCGAGFDFRTALSASVRMQGQGTKALVLVLMGMAFGGAAA